MTNPATRAALALPDDIEQEARAIADQFGLPWPEVVRRGIGRRRRDTVAIRKRVAWLLARRGHHTPAIGRALRYRDHTTVARNNGQINRQLDAGVWPW